MLVHPGRFIASVLVTVLVLVSFSFPAPQAMADESRDTVVENALPGTRDWRITTFTPESNLAGFTGEESFLPGDEVQLRVDSPGRAVEVKIYRLGHYGGLGGRLVTSAPVQAGAAQPACTVDSDRMVECLAWSVTHTFDTTGWTPGIHLAKIINDAGEAYVPIILRSPSHEGTVTVVSATSTHQAYNYYGQHSLYRGTDGTSATRALKVSFNRPFGSASHKITMYELGPIQHMESLGEKLSYTTSRGLESNPTTFAGSPAMVFLGHDEYWSVAMRSNVEQLRDRGTNLLFLGANSAFWRIRWSTDGRRITAYKDVKLDPVKDATSTTLFRVAPFANPEARLLGGQYVCNGVDNTNLAPLIISDPTFWAFKGTGVRKGQTLPNMVGHEIDQVVAESPSNVVVAGHSPYECDDRVVRYSDLTYYTAPSGAGVVNVGTFGFSYALTINPTAPPESVAFARSVVTTLVREAGKGPLGPRYPAAQLPDPVEPPDFVKNPQLLYVTPGQHTVNGRQWRTACEKYSQSQRCRTDIWGTQVTQNGGRFIKSNGWVFNNLTYLPMPSPGWGANPLARTGSWRGADGRKWRTECGTAQTGSGGCRTWIESSMIRAKRNAHGSYSYEWATQEVLNNMVRLR
ncbi:MAG: hypothetical protein Q4P15_02375 [Propionibacteriaceae bacterium]|nr:hypothetical protein [Propionibacteriaceae bacterium]